MPPISPSDPESGRRLAAFLAQHTDDSFTAATLNVNRIPFARHLNGPYRPKREVETSALLASFDVDMMQERFMSLPAIANHPYVSDDITKTRIKPNILKLRSDHHGLALTAKRPYRTLEEGHYSVVSANGGDNFAKKGWLIGEYTTPKGKVVVATTHLDSGDKPEDAAARAVQLRELEAALGRYRGRPLLVSGDFNIRAQSADESSRLKGMLDRLGLTLDIRQDSDGLDIIASRGLTRLQTLQYTDRTITDHALLAARYRLP